ncbi:membrane-spanning 4-domains subfamily A member 4A-like isoform X5 [Rhineura floridana]|uniref:membrane-spanning 4-domains subfamily A member 4A-like isoform X5 n=1 Tax=Rhineura floridana TaxID=261503 RepID=UPI002AC7FD5E|nr:membrane-spanning 4-domains subfamily A member 4A-like isoform X5 [Rhineura floridana]
MARWLSTTQWFNSRIVFVSILALRAADKKSVSKMVPPCPQTRDLLRRGTRGERKGEGRRKKQAQVLPSYHAAIRQKLASIDPGGSGAIISSPVVPHNSSLPIMGPGDSASVSSAQIVTQQPQLLSNAAASHSMQGMLKKFYKGEPLALGITQILIGFTGISFGLVMNIVTDYHLIYAIIMTPYWTGVPYIISGSLSVAAARNPKMPIVKGMLGMNVVSTVAAGIGIIFLSFSVAHFYYNVQWEVNYRCRDSNPDVAVKCYKTVTIPWDITLGTLAIFLVFNILEFCITISTAAFGCKTVCRDTYTETVVVVYQNVTPGNAVSLPAAVKDPEYP